MYRGIIIPTAVLWSGKEFNRNLRPDRGQDTIVKSYSAKKNTLSHTHSQSTATYAVQT